MGSWFSVRADYRCCIAYVSQLEALDSSRQLSYNPSRNISHCRSLGPHLCRPILFYLVSPFRFPEAQSRNSEAGSTSGMVTLGQALSVYPAMKDLSVSSIISSLAA